MLATHLGFYNTATTRTHVRFQFSTHAAAGGNVAPNSAFEAADIRIYKATDGAAFSATQRSSANGITMTSPFDSLTGFHDVDIDLTDNTDSGFYAAGGFYSIVLAPDETVDGQTLTGVVLAYFEIGVQPVNVTQFGGSAGTFSSGRPEVNASHIAGSSVSTSTAQIGVNVVNFGGSAGTFASGRPEVNTSHAAGTAWNSGAIGASTLASDTITAAKIAADAIGASELASDAVTEIQSGLATSSALSTLSGKFAGITLLAEWLGAIAGKQTANSTARTEIRATGAGSGTFDETTDSLEAVRDNVGTSGAGLTSVGDTSGTTTLLSRLTSTRAGYLDNLSAGAVATAAKLLSYFQSALRKDVTVDADIGGNYDDATDSQEAIRDRGDAAWTTATGFSTLDAAGVRSAVGLAIANLDTQLAALPTAEENADQVWEEALTDHSGTAGSTAEALGAAGSAGDPWATALPGSYTSGQAGKIIGDNLNATVSSRATPAQVNTEADTALADVGLTSTVTGRIDVAVSTRAPESGGNLAAVKAKTDNLPSDPADASDIASSFSSVASTLSTIAGYLDTEVAAIKAKTDNLPTDPADQSAVEAAITAAVSALATAAALATVASNVTGIKAKTDSLTFTAAGKVDARLARIGSADVQGAGTSGDTWRPA